MYAYLKGLVVEKGGDFIVIEVNNVGYEVLMSAYSLFEVEVGAKITCYTRLMIQEDNQALCGFITKDERFVFDSLVTVTSVGKKTALRILSSAPSSTIVSMIIQEDYAQLTKLPGIGKKTAERMVVELRDSFKKLYTDVPARNVAPEEESYFTTRDEDVMLALSSLGFSKPEINRMMQGLDSQMTVEEAISYALKKKR